MKVLVKILLGGFAAFMVLAIAEEWDFFSSAWFGPAQEAPAGLSEEDRRAAADTVHLALTLMGHFYTSGGDPRFAERMPVSQGILEEMSADVDYLGRNHRVQEMDLERLEILSVQPLDEGRLEIRTREFWTVRYLWATGGREVEPARTYGAHGRYLLSRDDRGWRVEAWENVDPSREPDEGA